MREQGWTVEIYAHPEGFTAQAYTFLNEPPKAIDRVTDKFVSVSLPDVICRAALQATTSAEGGDKERDEEHQDICCSQ